MRKVKLDSQLQLEKALRVTRRAGNMVEKKTRAKVKCKKDSDSNPRVVNRDVLVDTATGVGELATKKHSVGKINVYEEIFHKTRCKETFVNGQAQQRKGKVTTNPRKKGKRKRERKGQTPQKGNHNQNQTGSPDEETGQHTLSDFGTEGQRVQFVGDVQRHDDGFEAPREDHK